MPQFTLDPSFDRPTPSLTIPELVAGIGAAPTATRSAPPAVVDVRGVVVNTGPVIVVVPGLTTVATARPIVVPLEEVPITNARPVQPLPTESNRLVRLVVEVQPEVAPLGLETEPLDAVRNAVGEELSGFSTSPRGSWPRLTRRGGGGRLGSYVEPLFPGAAHLAEDPMVLRCFFVVTLPITIGQAQGARYDVAYRLASNQLFRTVSPEGFFKRFVPFSGFFQQDPPPGDMAWHLRVTKVPQAATIQPEAGGQTNGAGVTVAHPDTGWLPHPQLTGAVDIARQFNTLEVELDPPRWEDPRNATDQDTWADIFHGHGTATASVLASRGIVTAAAVPGGRGAPRSGVSNVGTDRDPLAFLVSPDADIVGAAPGATVMPVRCVDSVLLVGDVEVSRAVWWGIRQHAEVCSMSIGGYPAWHLEAVVAHATRVEQMIVCAAAGNLVPWVVYPAAYRDCIAVAGSSFAGEPWDASSHGPEVTVSAPAEDLWVGHVDGNSFVVKPGKGTSYAAPQVAAAAARWLAHHGRASLLASYSNTVPLQEVFRSLLASTAQNTRAGGLAWDPTYGAGVLDVQALINAPLPAASSFPPMSPADFVRATALENAYQVLYEWDPSDVVAFLEKLLPGWNGQLEVALQTVGIEVLHHLLGTEAANAAAATAATVDRAVTDVTSELKKLGNAVSTTLQNLFGW